MAGPGELGTIWTGATGAGVIFDRPGQGSAIWLGAKRGCRASSLAGPGVGARFLDRGKVWVPGVFPYRGRAKGGTI